MVSVGRTTEQQLLLGEWACLGILYSAPTHGFAIAARLTPNGDVGRDADDVVALWRTEFSRAALRFLDRLPVAKP